MNPPPMTLAEQLGDRDLQILHNLERFRLLTTRQIQRLHFPAKPFGSHTNSAAATRSTTRVLNRLEDHGTIRRLAGRIGGAKHGSAVTIWQLGPAGDRLLRERRGESSRRRFVEPSPHFTRHTVAVADVAVALIEAATTGRFDILTLETEPHCWRTFQTGTSTVTLKPDLAVVTADQETETHSFIEVDLGTEHRPALRRKCMTYQRYAQAGEEQQRTGLYPAVVWIATDQARARVIRDAIRSDEALDPSLFWVCTQETMLKQLAPYSTEPDTLTERSET